MRDENLFRCARFELDGRQILAVVEVRSVRNLLIEERILHFQREQIPPAFCS